MFNILFSVYFFSTIAVYTECTQPEIFEVINEFMAANGIDSSSDNLKFYSSRHDKEASVLLERHNFDENKNTSFLSLLPNEYAAVFGLANAPGAMCYAKENLKAIVEKIKGDGNSHFLLDVAYKQVTILMGNETQDRQRPYCLLFSIPRDSVKTLMPKRICSVVPVESYFFSKFDRLTYYWFDSLSSTAERILKGLQEDEVDPEIHTVIDVSIPTKHATSWDGVVRYLASGENATAAKAILDPCNISVGIDYNWQIVTEQANGLSSLRVVMVFQKIITKGRRSIYRTILENIKKARSERKVENDLLVDVFPTAEANRIAEEIAAGDNTNAQTALHGRVRYYDTNREENPDYMIDGFKSVSERWIKAAQKPKNPDEKKYEETLFYGPYTGIGFAAKVVKDESDGKHYWSFCIYFSGKNDTPPGSG